jgi:virginiamycin B lyase
MSRSPAGAAILLGLLTLAPEFPASAIKITDGSFGATPVGLTLTREMQVAVVSGTSIVYGFTASADIPGASSFVVTDANTLTGVVSTPGYYWVLDAPANAIRRVSAATMTAVPFPVTTPASGLAALTVGPDGNIWFTEQSANKIGRLLSYAPNTITEFNVPALNANPGGIVSAERKDELWFVEEGAGNNLGRITTAGVITEFAIPTAAAVAHGVVAKGTTTVFTESAANKIGVFNQTLETFTETVVPTQFGQPWGIALGPDGGFWFTENLGNKIGRLNGVGSIVEYTIPTASSSPGAIIRGEQNDLWFVEEGAHKLGRVRLTLPGDVNGDAAVDVADVFYLINFLFAGGSPPR